MKPRNVILSEPQPGPGVTAVTGQCPLDPFGGCAVRLHSNINLLLCVPLEIPARRVSEVWHQRPDAGPILGLRELIFGLAILFVNHVQRLDGHTPEGLTSFRYPVAKGDIIGSIEQGRQRQGGAQSAKQ